jgi:hypothetical protein
MPFFLILLLAFFSSPAHAEASAANIVDAGIELFANANQVDAGVEKAQVPVAPPSTNLNAPAISTALTRMRGRFGVGYFGTASNPSVSVFGLGGLGGLGALSVTSNTLTPLFGVRYWSPLPIGPLQSLGFELAVGIASSRSTLESQAGPMAVLIQTPSVLTYATHAAVVLPLVSTENVIISLAPEFRYANSTSTPRQIATPLGAPLQPRASVSESSSVSIRAAAEFFFGFIGLPNLSLEAMFRVSAIWTNLSADVFLDSVLSSTMSNFVAREGFNVNTSFVNGPVEILTSSVTAKYYF